MGKFDNILRDEESLFKQEEALSYEYLPKVIPHREKEQEQIASAIRPILKGMNGRNILIHGPPGVGKTAAVRHLLEELDENDEFSDKLNLVYINCWEKNTSFKIIEDICNKIGYAFTQNKNTEQLFEVGSQILNKKAAVIVFDEVDKTKDQDFLYSLMMKVSKKTIVMITNYKSWLLDLDERIKSRVMPEQLEFKPYNQNETKDILEKRKEYAFYDDVWEKDAFEYVAEKCFRLRDIRSGLFLMKESGLEAEDEASRKINKKHAEKAVKKLSEFTIKNSEELDSELKFILKIIKENSGKKIGDLYKIYKKNAGEYSYKTFQRKISKLDEGKFITLEKTHSGGNTTIVNKKLSDF